MYIYNTILHRILIYIYNTILHWIIIYIYNTNLHRIMIYIYNTKYKYFTDRQNKQNLQYSEMFFTISFRTLFDLHNQWKYTIALLDNTVSLELAIINLAKIISSMKTNHWHFPTGTLMTNMPSTVSICCNSNSALRRIREGVYLCHRSVLPLVRKCLTLGKQSLWF